LPALRHPTRRNIPIGAANQAKRERRDIWTENNCTKGNNHVAIGKENYDVGADGSLMPAKRDQPPPDLRYFKQRSK
jgi:hypothetical protein